MYIQKFFFIAIEKRQVIWAIFLTAFFAKQKRKTIFNSELIFILIKIYICHAMNMITLIKSINYIVIV